VGLEIVGRGDINGHPQELLSLAPAAAVKPACAGRDARGCGIMRRDDRERLAVIKEAVVAIREHLALRK